MNISAEFVRSAARVEDFPRDGLSEVALVGRSNVGKSSLINALLRQRVARTSAAPGKTRLANLYRIVRGGATPFYLVDLPGYGYARGGQASASEFEELTQLYFGRVGRLGAPAAMPSRGPGDRRRGIGVSSRRGWGPGASKEVGRGRIAALLLVDARHPGLDSDLEAWQWLQSVVKDHGIVATKVDKLARGERIRAMRELESVHGQTVLPVSAVTGEGLDQLWKLIDRLANSPNPQRRRSSPPGALPRHKKNP